MKEELELLTEDHPEAKGHTARPGDEQYTLRFPLEDGRELVVRMGAPGFHNLTDLLMDMLSNAPSHNDGTTNVPIE